VTTPGPARRTFFLKYTILNGSFVAALRSSNQLPWQQPSQQTQQQSSGKNMHQDTNQILDQTVQAKNINNNVTDDVFLAITMVQLIMTTVWSCDRK
jgi:hypothetical protein